MQLPFFLSSIYTWKHFREGIATHVYILAELQMSTWTAALDSDLPSGNPRSLFKRLECSGLVARASFVWDAFDERTLLEWVYFLRINLEHVAWGNLL